MCVAVEYDGKREGKGVLTLPCGQAVYEGAFRNDLRDGFGTITCGRTQWGWS